MGMFDWVNAPEMGCPYCKNGILKTWQSKSGTCQGETLDYWTVRKFYAICRTCSKFVCFERKDGGVPSAYFVGYVLKPEEKES